MLKINFSLILLCDGDGVAMRWPFRVICMPLCSGLAWPGLAVALLVAAAVAPPRLGQQPR